MSQRESSRRHWMLWLFIGSFFTVVIFVSTLTSGENRIFEPTKEPSATFDTSNGGKLEILRVAAGKMEFGETRRPQRFFSFSTGSKGSSGGSFGGMHFYEEQKKEETTYLRLEGDSPGDVIIEIRLLDGSLKARKISSYLNSNNSVSEDSRIANPTTRDGHSYEPKGEGTIEILEAMGRSNLEILFQYKDPDSGWIDMGGPGMAWEKWPDRYYLTLNTWQRNQPDLDFRMIENDGSITEFHLPNPDFKTTGIPTKAATLPFIHTNKNFTVTVNGLKRTPFRGEQPFVALDMEIVYTGPNVDGLPDGPIHFEGNRKEASDEWGNITSVVRKTISGKTAQGIRFPQNSRLATTVFTIQTNRSFPQDQPSGVLVLEGRVNAPGTSIDFVETSGAANFSQVSITNCKIGKPTYNNFPATKDKNWKELSFEIECRADTKKYGKLVPRIGEHSQWIPLVFVGENTLSSGLGYSQSGGYSTNPQEVSMKDGFSKIFPPQALLAGQKIRIAIHKAPQDEKFEVVLPLPPMDP